MDLQRAVPVWNSRDVSRASHRQMCVWERGGVHRAAVWLFAGVGALVPDQVAWPLEAAVTGIAAMRLFDRVCALVPHGVVLAPEPPLA